MLHRQKHMTCIYNITKTKTYDMYIQFYTDKVHLIYQNKHFATLH